jgi:hypothetical protein
MFLLLIAEALVRSSNFMMKDTLEGRKMFLLLIAEALVRISIFPGKRYWRAPEALESCKPLFKEFKILTVYSLYILESAKFVKKYPEKFTKNKDHPDTRMYVTQNTKHNENDLYVATCRNTNFVQNPLIMLSAKGN